MDFFTVPTLTSRVLFVLVVLSHCRRRIVHFNVTEHPATWAAQQVVEAFPDETALRWLHRDRDSVYSESFQQRVAGMGIAEVVSASPWQNPYVERLIGTKRRECLDHKIVLNAPHLRRILTIYSRYYHRSRTHLGLEKDAPAPRPVSPPSAGSITTAAWTAQQVREAFPWDEAPRYLIHDRDHAFDALGATAKAMGIEEVLTAPHAPWLNPFGRAICGIRASRLFRSRDRVQRSRCSEVGDAVRFVL